MDTLSDKRDYRIEEWREYLVLDKRLARQVRLHQANIKADEFLLMGPQTARRATKGPWIFNKQRQGIEPVNPEIRAAIGLLECYNPGVTPRLANVRVKYTGPFLHTVDPRTRGQTNIGCVRTQVVDSRDWRMWS